MKSEEKFIALLKENYLGRELSSVGETMVNSFSFNPTGFCKMLREDPVTVEKFERIAKIWVKTLSSYNNWQIDGRNEIAVNKSKILRGMIDVEIDYTNEELNFAEKIPTWHRTLQQTFSGLVYQFIDESGWVKFEDERWYRCPMI